MENGFFKELIDYLISLIGSIGYFGVFLTVSLEYACFPLPSEIILPFIGFIASGGSISLFGAIVVSSLAGIVGSLICYYIGYFGGKPVLDYIGDKFKGSRGAIHSAKSWFDRYDRVSVFLARLLPLARTYISIPAGIAKMNVWVFILFSSLGIFLWNTVLISIGYYLGSNWSIVETFMREYTIAAGIVILLGVLSIIYIKIRSKKSLKKNKIDNK